MPVVLLLSMCRALTNICLMMVSSSLQKSRRPAQIWFLFSTNWQSVAVSMEAALTGLYSALTKGCLHFFGEEGAALERRERFGRGEDDLWTLSDILEIMAVWKQSEQTDDGQTAQTNDGSAHLWRRRWRYSPRREGSLQHELRNSEGRDYYFVV